MSRDRCPGQGWRFRAQPPIRPPIAFFWFENGSFAWNRIARKLSGGMSLMQHARLYAALNAAMCRRIATTLEIQFYYNFWRP